MATQGVLWDGKERRGPGTGAWAWPRHGEGAKGGTKKFRQGAEGPRVTAGGRAEEKKRGGPNGGGSGVVK